MTISRFYEDFGYARRVVLQRSTYNLKDLCFDVINCIKQAIEDDRVHDDVTLPGGAILDGTPGSSPPMNTTAPGHFWEVMNYQSNDDVASLLIQRQDKSDQQVLFHGRRGTDSNTGQLYVGMGENLHVKFSAAGSLDLLDDPTLMSVDGWSGLRNFNGNSHVMDGTANSNLNLSKGTASLSISMTQARITDPKWIGRFCNGVFVVEYRDAIAVFLGYNFTQPLFYYGALAGNIYSPLNHNDYNSGLTGNGINAGYLEPPTNYGQYTWLSNGASRIELGDNWYQVQTSYALKSNDLWLKKIGNDTLRFIPYVVSPVNPWGGLAGFTKYVRIIPFNAYSMANVRSDSLDSKQGWLVVKSNPRGLRRSHRRNTAFLWQNDGEGISKSISPIILS